MKKVLIPLSLTVALAAPIVFAARWETALDGGLRPFQAGEISVARDSAVLDGFARPGRYRTLVAGAAIPGSKAASCQVRLVKMDGSVVEEVRMDIPGGTNEQFDFADRIGSREVAAANVSCDQPFYPYAAAAGADDPKVTWGELRGPSGQCDFTVPATELDQPGVFIAAKAGTIHTATTGKEKGIVCIKAPRNLQLSRLRIEWDVNTGPWHKKTPHGNHAMIWLHRGRFRSDSVANVNAFGPKKSFIKMNQNVDLKKGNTNTKTGLALKPNNQYHVRYTYDAVNKRIFTEVFEDGALIKKMEMAGTARNRTLAVPVFGYSQKGSLFAEFGHYRGQHFPELPSYGWRYSNLRVELHAK